MERVGSAALRAPDEDAPNVSIRRSTWAALNSRGKEKTTVQAE
jgi:hypothetical protein